VSDSTQQFAKKILKKRKAEIFLT